MTTPDLTTFDLILVSTSAGKDSQAMLDFVVEQADLQGVRDRVHAVHADLGRVEWSGTRDLAEAQAAHYGVPFHVVSRPQGDLLEQVRQRGMWPDNKNRYCTSDHKRDQIGKVVTSLVKDLCKDLGRRVRVLNCMGLRAQESTARSKKSPLTLNRRWTNKTKRETWDWLPILDWSEDQVWDRIRSAGTTHHWAYDIGMPRLSCVFCIFAPEQALCVSGRHNLELLREYVQVEQEIGHTFRKNLPIATILDKVEAALQDDTSDTFDTFDMETWSC